MTVKELIDQLSNFNPRSEIQVEDLYEEYYLINKIYQSPYSSLAVVISLAKLEE